VDGGGKHGGEAPERQASHLAITSFYYEPTTRNTYKLREIFNTASTMQKRYKTGTNKDHILSRHLHTPHSSEHHFVEYRCNRLIHSTLT
jgi:hypothetical protein